MGEQVDEVIVTVNPANRQNVNIPLQPGWNLVSVPVVPDHSDIGTVLKPVIGRVVVVWGYSSATKAWSFFRPGPPVAGSLRTITDGNGYWIYVTAGGVFNVTGSVIPETQFPQSYQLSPGWNLVGFKPLPAVGRMTVDDYLRSLGNSYDRSNVWVYDNMSGLWIRADSTHQLQPGQAMWILMTAPATLRP